jgi:hypothetical protein
MKKGCASGHPGDAPPRMGQGRMAFGRSQGGG